MVCVPIGSALRGSPGASLLAAGRIAMGLAPSKKVTVPLGNAPAGVTNAERVMGVPSAADNEEELRAMVLGAGVAVTVIGAELLGRCTPSPK